MFGITRQEILCHECKKWIQFEVDLDLDGMHEFKCPECGHMHYRVVKDGEITDDRYALDPSHYKERRQYYNTTGSLYDATVCGTSTASVYYNDSYPSTSASDAGADFLRQSWVNRSDSTGYY